MKNKKFLNKIIHGDCVEILEKISENSIDLVVTSPPYDNLRSYKGYKFEFEKIAELLFKVISPGGIVVWVVGELAEGEQERTLLMQLQGTGWSAQQSRAIYDLARNQQ